MDACLAQSTFVDISSAWYGWTPWSAGISYPAFPSGPSSASFSTTSWTSETSTTPSLASSQTDTTSIPIASVVSVQSKKGLCYNDAALTSLFDGSEVSWAYDWGSTGGAALPGYFEYVPMLWGLNDVSYWFSAASSALSGGSRHLLSFNEPDIETQANMTPDVAAVSHIAYLNPFAGQVRVSSPAISNAQSTDPPQGVAWLENFFTACDGRCTVDFVAYHWYGGGISDLASFSSQVIAVAASHNISSVWLTEFGGTGMSADQADVFLQSAMAYLEGVPQIERFAYFMCANGILVEGESLSSSGNVYYTN